MSSRIHIRAAVAGTDVLLIFGVRNPSPPFELYVHPRFMQYQYLTSKKRGEKVQVWRRMILVLNKL